MSDNVETALRERIAQLEARLEIDHVYEMDPDSGELERIEVPADERGTLPDAITCREVQVAHLQAELTDAWKRIDTLKAALLPFAKIKPTLVGGAEAKDYWVVIGSPDKLSFTNEDLARARAAIDDPPHDVETP